LIETIEASITSVEGGALGTWASPSFNGDYTIHLQVNSFSSGSSEASVDVTADNTLPEANIVYPSDGSTFEGDVSILGTAKDQYIDRFTLEYGEGASPTTFLQIAEGFTSVDLGLLSTWETTGLDGLYTVKLTVYDKVGFSATDSIQLNIAGGADLDKKVVPQPGYPLTYAYPNPFTPSAGSSPPAEVTFNYSLNWNFGTQIYLFDLNGNLIWQNTFAAGTNGGKAGANNPAWDENGIGKNPKEAKIANGVYIYSIVTNQQVLARGKLIILN
jgi:hypothetical protein